ncbi:hypothetical protein GCM10010280_43880 [Streptomyces pilosus]|uniref:Uncharacterized protein n=1 Tax=Streptomyces pilosus TaxID=28893 RepID=A0A918F116_9ACTN|nr:hypothetical protein GCM10010280_43880 [Streptomyces pilosus]
MPLPSACRKRSTGGEGALVNPDADAVGSPPAGEPRSEEERGPDRFGFDARLLALSMRGKDKIALDGRVRSSGEQWADHRSPTSGAGTRMDTCGTAEGRSRPTVSGT